MRRFWKLWYRALKWWRYRSYYKNLPDAETALATVHNVEDRCSPHGDVVKGVTPGLVSRPIPTRTDVSSKYGQRVARVRKAERPLGIDEELVIRPNRSR